MNLNNIDIYDDNILDLVDSLDDTKIGKYNEKKKKKFMLKLW